MWHLHQIMFLIGLDKKNSSLVSESRDLGVSSFTACFRALRRGFSAAWACLSVITSENEAVGLLRSTPGDLWPCAGRQPLLGTVAVRTEKGSTSGGKVPSGSTEEHLQPPSV